MPTSNGERRSWIKNEIILTGRSFERKSVSWHENR
jgi:hypothetical protein